MDKKPLSLWCAYPDDLLIEENAEACAALLSQDERARWQGFRFERHAREYLATHSLARTALSRYHPLAPQAWRFPVNAHGKPAADPECGLRFNLSNSLGLVVCLIAHGVEVGVDVEPFDHAEKILELAPEVFSPEELTQLSDLRGDEQLQRALSLWTLKEAYIKARGMGLALPLKKFAFLFGGGEEMQLELAPSLNDEAARWQFCLLEHRGHRIALMTERTAGQELEIWEQRPSQGEPVRLPGAAETWFPRPPSGSPLH
jgi:4'-phosphopantetheinyl transferase